jgi:hypothetical protein
MRQIALICALLTARSGKQSQRQLGGSRLPLDCGASPASADRIVANGGSIRRPTPDGCRTELLQPVPATGRPVTRRHLPLRHGMAAAADGFQPP